MSMAEVFLYGVLVKSALEDVQSLSISQEWLLIAWAALAGWGVFHGHLWVILLLLVITAWGLGHGPGWLAGLFLPAIPYWPVLLLGAGAREGMVGEGDVLAVSLAALISPWAGWFALGGMLFWAWWHKRRGGLWFAGTPGALLGFTMYLLLSLIGVGFYA